MQERNIIGGTATLAFATVVEFYKDLMPYLILAVVLVLVDLRFGTKAAISRGETVRTSRKWRRTFNKLIDYLCYDTWAGLFGSVFTPDLLGSADITSHRVASMFMLVIYVIELSSIINNYFEYKGINKKFNIAGFISDLFKVPDIKKYIEDKKNKEK